MTHFKTFKPRATTFDVFQDLMLMHEKFLFSKVNMTKLQMKSRLDFIQEELDEAYEALDTNNADDLVDALIDITVVSVGTLDLGKVNGWAAWDEVHTANMAKEIGVNSKRPDSGGMDLRKPEGWKKPSHSDNVGSLPVIMMRVEGYKPRSIMSSLRRRALEFLEECKQLMVSKAEDYNFPGSRVKSADYYPRGLDDLEHMLHVKYLRIMSIIDKMKAGAEINNEGLQDSLKDLIVFSSMMAEFSEGKMDGQDPSKDLFGNEKKV